MRAIFALAIKTIHSAVRSKVVHVLIFFSMLTVFVLPLTLVSDGTAKGLVQVSLTYTLGLTGILLSVSAVWLGSTLMSEDIEGYQIHMVVVKPVSRASVWFGKWLGIVAMLGAILLFDAAVIYAMCQFRLYRSSFPKHEMMKLKAEVLVGRRLLQPTKPDLREWAEKEYRRQIAAGFELTPGMTKEMGLEQLISQVSRGEGKVGFRKKMPFVFKNIPDVPDETPIYLRYRVFVKNSSNMEQRETLGDWFFENPRSAELRTSYLRRPVRTQGGIFTEIVFPKDLISDARELRVDYFNRDPEGKAIEIQRADGPMLMIEAVPFLNNYFRVVALIFVQILFMATLGCATGSVLSTPVAVFVSFSYVMTGVFVRFLRPMNGAIPAKATNPLLIISDYVATGIKAATFSLNDFVQIDSLSDGRLIELNDMFVTLATVVGLRALPVALIGILFFSRRELGLVIRK